jgi:hypothetical protein
LIALDAGEDCRTISTRAGVRRRDRGQVDLAGTTGGPGLAAVFEPGERHAVRAIDASRLLLVLAPWPGEGHPGARDAVRS